MDILLKAYEGEEILQIIKGIKKAAKIQGTGKTVGVAQAKEEKKNSGGIRTILWGLGTE
jgi:hypothetical protein